MDMTGIDLEARRRRLSFRVWHRGMREVDLLLGRFADAHLSQLNEWELGSFEDLLDVPDPQILAWILGEEAVPDDFDSPALRRIIAFHSSKA
jgi:antitoxin CptB